MGSLPMWGANRRKGTRWGSGVELEVASGACCRLSTTRSKLATRLAISREKNHNECWPHSTGEAVIRQEVSHMKVGPTAYLTEPGGPWHCNMESALSGCTVKWLWCVSALVHSLSNPPAGEQTSKDKRNFYLNPSHRLHKIPATMIGEEKLRSWWQCPCI